MASEILQMTSEVVISNASMNELSPTELVEEIKAPIIQFEGVCEEKYRVIRQV